MFYNEQSEDYRPLFWLAGRPIYATAFLIILHVVAFIVVAICQSFLGQSTVTDAIGLIPQQVIFRGEVWRLVSYIVFPVDWTIMFIFAMGFLYFAGNEVEQFVGRKTFFKLYAALVLIPALLLCGLEFFLPVGGHLGGMESVFGVFIAFATLYPGFVLNIWFVPLTAKGWAYVLLGVYSLYDIAVPGHDWTSLLLLWASAGVGYMAMGLSGAGRGFAWFTNWLEARREARLERERNFKVLKDTKANESIDEILDKISKHGVNSLNAKERAALERARTNLLKRDGR